MVEQKNVWWAGTPLFKESRRAGVRALRYIRVLLPAENGPRGRQNVTRAGEAGHNRGKAYNLAAFPVRYSIGRPGKWKMDTPTDYRHAKMPSSTSRLKQ